MRKKKIIEAAVNQLEKENTRQSTLTINQDGITINGAMRPNTLTISNDIYADTIISPNYIQEWYEAKDDAPKEFHPLLCTRCGGNLAFKNEFLVCEYCGTTYSSNINVEEEKRP